MKHSEVLVLNNFSKQKSISFERMAVA